MDQHQPPFGESPTPSRSTAPAPRARKKWSPLAIVLALSVVFFGIFLAVSGAFFMNRGGSAGFGGPGDFFGKGSVAVVELKGVITDSRKLVSKLRRLEKDKNIKAVVLRINSPGGAVAPSQEIYQEVRNYKKPIIASMGSVAASGAFYVACGTRKIFADPGTITGSIGVIMEFVNLSKLYKWAKIQRYSIKTGPYKDAGAEYRALTPQEKALFQNMVDDVLTQFKKAVSTGRKLSMSQVTAIADGRVFSGHQALEEKLVDQLGSLRDAIKAAAKMGGIKGKPHVIYPEHRRPSFLDLVLHRGESSSGQAPIRQIGVVSELARLLTGRSTQDIAVLSPGVYWLWTGR